MSKKEHANELAELSVKLNEIQNNCCLLLATLQEHGISPSSRKSADILEMMSDVQRYCVGMGDKYRDSQKELKILKAKLLTAEIANDVLVEMLAEKMSDASLSHSKKWRIE